MTCARCLAKAARLMLFAAFAAFSTMAGIANAAEIKVIGTGSFKEAFGDLAPAFERSSGHKVAAIWAGTDDIIRRLSAGETSKPRMC